jgi:pimeloyl-ACP methyl ester carboxylesterase
VTHYVLIHGAWASAWVWRDFIPLLTSQGHTATAPTLTGLGERVHLASPEVSLQTHVQDVLNHMFFEDVTDVTLVGHSYGGQVITGVADRAPERIKHLVYLDAFLHRNGETIMQVNEGPGSRPLELEDGWKLSPRRPPQTPDAPLPTAMELWRRARTAPMPVHTMDTGITLSMPLEDRPFTRTYIKASADKAPPDGTGNPAFWQAAEFARSHPAWSYFEVPTSHNVQILMPDELARILLTLT